MSQVELPDFSMGYTHFSTCEYSMEENIPQNHNKTCYGNKESLVWFVQWRGKIQMETFRMRVGLVQIISHWPDPRNCHCRPVLIVDHSCLTQTILANKLTTMELMCHHKEGHASTSQPSHLPGGGSTKKPSLEKNIFFQSGVVESIQGAPGMDTKLLG